MSVVTEFYPTDRTDQQASPNATTTTTTETREQSKEKQTQINSNNNNRVSLLESKYFPIILSSIGTYKLFNENYNVNYSEIIGSGNESKVYHGINKKNHNNVAINITILSSKTELIYWYVKYLSIKECNFYNLYESYLGEPQPHSLNNKYAVILVQELLDKNLTQIMADNNNNNSNNNNSMDETECRNMIYQLCQQLSILNKTQNYVHLDIKPTNIMKRKSTSSENNLYTLIDFGFSMEMNSIYAGYLGTPEWSSPEMIPLLGGNNRVYESTDMWSIALIVIYCMFNGQHPFINPNNPINNLSDINKWYNDKIKNNELFIQRWIGNKLFHNQISYNLFDFLLKSLKYDPNQRLTATNALKHSWFKDI